MESDQQQILGLIQKMRTNQVNQAEEKLMALVQSSPHFMEKMFNVIKSNKNQRWINTIASTFLNRFICQKIEIYGYQNMFTAISNIMGSYEITSTDKRCFQRSLVTLIQYIKQPQQIQEWRNFILKHVNDPLLLDTGLLLISCTAVSELQTDFLCIIVQQTFQLTLNTVQVAIQNANVVNQLIKNWIVVFDKLKIIQKQQTVDQTLRKIACSRKLAQIIKTIYQLGSPNQIFLCINPDLYQLNILKYEAAELHAKIGEYALKNKIYQKQCPFLKLIIQEYVKVKNTLGLVGTNLQLIQTFQCPDFVTSLISLLIIYIRSQNENHIPLFQLNVLVHMVCFPFLATRQEEMYIFEQSPVQFNALVEDICDKQTFGILKTQAAKLLQTISDYNADAAASAIQYCIQSIKVKNGFIQSFETAEMKILPIEVAFQILALFSFNLQNYPKSIEALKIILCDKRLMELPALDLSKVFLFLAYNYGEVFKNPTQGNMWIQFGLHYKFHPTVRYIALDFISNICDQYFNQKFFNQIIKLITDCGSKESGQVWNIILKIFDSQKELITEALCLNLVNSVLQRIQKQVSLLDKKQKQSTIDVINALHVLRRIIESTEYISDKLTLKDSIFRITMIFSKATQLNIQDQLIKIINEYLKFQSNSQSIVNQIFIDLLPQILAQFKKQQYHERAYFVLFNELIIKSPYQKIKPIIKTLLTGLMFHLFDMSQQARKIKMKVAIANILTILQNLLSIHGYEMSGENEDSLCQIGAMCIRLFPAKEDQKIFSKVLLAKALNLMFICHLYSRADNTVDYLVKYAKQNIFHKYDAYVLIKLLSKAIFSEDNPQIVVEYLNLMIEISNQEQKNAKKGNTIKTAKGKMKLKRQQELNKILQKITSPFLDFQIKRIDNVIYPLKKQVIGCITNMKSNNVDTYKLIIMNMNEEQKSKLNLIVNQTIEVDGKNRIIRKVLGVKSQANQRQNELIKNKDDEEMQQNQIQTEQQSFKRERVLKKKKQGKKSKTQKIAIE